MSMLNAHIISWLLFSWLAIHFQGQTLLTVKWYKGTHEFYRSLQKWWYKVKGRCNKIIWWGWAEWGRGGGGGREECMAWREKERRKKRICESCRGKRCNNCLRQNARRLLWVQTPTIADGFIIILRIVLAKVQGFTKEGTDSQIIALVIQG